MIYLLVIFVMAGAVFAAYSSNIQATTKWLGQQIAERKIIRTTPQSFATPLEVQTMISSSGQVARNLGGVLIYIVVALIGFFIKWWAALLALVMLVVISGLISAVFLPRRFSYWFQLVFRIVSLIIAREVILIGPTAYQFSSRFWLSMSNSRSRSLLTSARYDFVATGFSP